MKPSQSIRQLSFAMSHRSLWVALFWLGFQFLALAQITTRKDVVGVLLNQWANAKEAEGLDGITYENRDGEHSLFDYGMFPQLHRYQPNEGELAAKQNVGPATDLRNTPTFGNCSMAAPGDKGGSLPRFYYTDPGGMRFLSNQYLGNNLFFYPEHQDHDPGFNGRGGWGDMYPTNTPYLIISQGSSFTDKPFMQAFISATAAMKPEVRDRLIHSRMLMPTLQSLFRHSNSMVKSEADYFTGKAHPVVFEGSQINEERMVRLAHEMTLAGIPPVVVLAADSESTSPQQGVDYFEATEKISERIADTPCCLSRIFRGSAFKREMNVTAHKSTDLMGRKLTYKWVLLQGDPERVKIEPQWGGEEAKLSVAWHPGIMLESGIISNRVEIGVFAFNGATWSAPSFITFYMLPNEARFYDAKGRLEEIYYEAGNPDIGVPGLEDLRWLSLGRKLASGDQSLGIKLIRQAIPKDCVQLLKDLADELAKLQSQWRDLSADETTKKDADELHTLMLGRIRERLVRPITKDGQPLWRAVESVISKVANDPLLYPSLQDMLKLEGKAATARQGLLDFQILQAVTPGQFALSFKPSELTKGERYHLRQFNLTLLSETLLPEFLDRVSAALYVDPRLTTPKPWRDVYRYDKDGKYIGWTRMSRGHIDEFDTEGRVMPTGPNGKLLEVRYFKDTSGLKLDFAPQ